MVRKKKKRDYEDFRYELHLPYEDCNIILTTLRLCIDKINFKNNDDKENAIILEHNILEQMRKTIKITRQKIRNG